MDKLSTTPWVELNISRSTFYKYKNLLDAWQEREKITAKRQKRTPTIIKYNITPRRTLWDVDKLRTVLPVVISSGTTNP